jgi:hypothetical protein
MKKPPLVEAARVFRGVSDEGPYHMPKGTASGSGSGIIMMGAIFCTTVSMAVIYMI